MKKLMLGLLVFGLTTQCMLTQTIELSEVRVDANYKYLDAIDSEDVDISVKTLEKEVAFYNLKGSEAPNVYDLYPVTFVIPQGKIVAFYDKDGKINRTIERFKNIELPISVIEAVAEQYPEWTIADDAYKVDYYGKTGRAEKQYRVKLENEKKRKILKFDGNGEYL